MQLSSRDQGLGQDSGVSLVKLCADSLLKHTRRSYTVCFINLFKLYFSEEMKNPSRNIPLTVMTAVPAVIVFYLLVNISYLSVLTPKEIVSSGMDLIYFYLKGVVHQHTHLMSVYWVTSAHLSFPVRKFGFYSKFKQRILVQFYCMTQVGLNETDVIRC